MKKQVVSSLRMTVLCLSVWGACAASGETLEVATLKDRSNDAAGHSSLTNALKWSNGIAPVVDEAANYEYVHDHNTVRTLKAAATTLKAANYQVGKGTKAGEFALGNNGHSGAVFTFPKLTLHCGWMANYYVNGTFLKGSVVVTAPNTAPFACYAMHQALNAETQGATMTFLDSFSGDAGTGIIFQRAKVKPNETPNYDGGTHSNTVYAFSGSLENFKGNMDLCVYQQNEEGYQQALNRGHHVTMRILSTTAFNGTLHLHPSTILDVNGATLTFTPKNLTLDAQSKLLLAVDAASPRDSAPLVVTDALTLPTTGRVALKVTVSGTVPTGQKTSYPLVTAPAGRLSRDKFLCTSTTGAPFTYEVRTDEETQCATLYAVLSPVVTLTASDGSKVSESFSHGTTKVTIDGKTVDISDVTKWSDGKFPQSGFCYLVENKTLRTPAKNKDGSTPISFRGDALTFRNGAGLEVRANPVVMNRLYVEALTKDVTIKYLSGGTSTLKGNFYLASQGDYSLTYELAQNRTFVHEEKWIGSGKVVLAAGFENNANPPQGTHKMNVPNPDFSGVVHVAYKQTADTHRQWDPEKDGKDVTIVPNWNQCCRVEFSDPMVFGVGPRGVVNHQAILLEDYSVLKPLESMTFDNPYRGWSIENAYMFNADEDFKKYGAPVARFDVPAGVTMTFRERLNFNANYATLVKEGEGCLALGGFEPTFWKGNDEATATVSNNMFRIRKGAVKLLTGNVTECLQVFIAEAARFVFEAYPTDQTLQEYGLLNHEYRKGREDRTDDRIFYGKPLQCEEGSSKINVEIVDQLTGGGYTPRSSCRFSRSVRNMWTR